MSEVVLFPLIMFLWRGLRNQSNKNCDTLASRARFYPNKVRINKIKEEEREEKQQQTL
jgi:hypothetical protein